MKFELVWVGKRINDVPELLSNVDISLECVTSRHVHNNQTTNRITDSGKVSASKGCCDIKYVTK